MPLAEDVDLSKLQAVLEEHQPQVDVALEAIGTVHYARFVLLDGSSPNLQPRGGTGPFRLAVITSYDGDFDVYIQAFVDEVGRIFDALLQFSADGAGLVPVCAHVEEFTAYIAANDASRQPPNNAFEFYSAYPYSVPQVLADASS